MTMMKKEVVSKCHVDPCRQAYLFICAYKNIVSTLSKLQVYTTLFYSEGSENLNVSSRKIGGIISEEVHTMKCVQLN